MLTCACDPTWMTDHVAVSGGLVALETLNLPHNSLTTLPASIGQLPALKTLWLSDNKLTTVPDLSCLHNLTKLILDGNPLERVPMGIRGLPSLKVLSMCTCALEFVPDWLSSIRSLEELRLGVNALTSLPAELGGFPNLTELDLSYNDLRTLPPEIGRLRRLRVLYLQGQATGIDVLPAEVGLLAGVIKVQLGLIQGHICASIGCCCSLLVPSLDGDNTDSGVHTGTSRRPADSDDDRAASEADEGEHADAEDGTDDVTHQSDDELDAYANAGGVGVTGLG